VFSPARKISGRRCRGENASRNGAQKLDATASFHGTIYAPETDVRVGSDFEVYGGIVAKRLEIGPNARLHFDNARYEGSPFPRIVSWRLVEVPASVRGRRLDPFLALGVDRETLLAMGDAHDLASVMLTIEYLDPSGVQTLLRQAEKDKIGLALKGASETVRDLFFSNMSERAAKIMKEDMQALGPVRLRDVDEAQMYMVTLAKELAAKNEIIIADNKGEDELVY